MADSAVSDPTIVRLFITSEALRLSADRMQIEYADLSDTLHQMEAKLSSLAGLEYEECVRRFGDSAIRQLTQSLAQSELGWFVRGVWDEATTAGESAGTRDRPIFGFGLSLRSVNCLLMLVLGR